MARALFGADATREKIPRAMARERTSISGHRDLIMQLVAFGACFDDFQVPVGTYNETEPGSLWETKFYALKQLDSSATISVHDQLRFTVADRFVGGGIRAAVKALIHGGILVPSVHTCAHKGRSGIAPTRREARKNGAAGRAGIVGRQRRGDFRVTVRRPYQLSD